MTTLVEALKKHALQQLTCQEKKARASNLEISSYLLGSCSRFEHFCRNFDGQ